MIVSKGNFSASPKVQSLSGQGSKPGWTGAAYQGFKTTAKAFGFYKDIEPYLPDKYVKKYTYKPHKRVAGYLGQKIHEKKRYGSNYNIYKKPACVWNRNYVYKYQNSCG